LTAPGQGRSISGEPSARAALLPSAPAEIIRLDPTTDRRWSEALQRQPQRSAFHSSAWARALRDTYGFKPCYLVLAREGSPGGLLPLMEVDSWLTGRRGVCLPFTDECSVLAPDLHTHQQLLDAALQLGRERGWRHFEYRGPMAGPTPPGLPPTFVGHSIDLVPNEQVLLSRCAPGVRRALRKAEREQVRVACENSLAAMRAYYGLHLAIRRHHGIPPQPWRFFENIQRHLLSAGLGFVSLARANGRTVAGAVFLHEGHQAIFKFGASDRASQSLRANNLVMWESMRRLRQAGVRTLSLGRSSIAQEGLRRFKKGFGAAEYEIRYRRFEPSGALLPSPADPASGWHNHVFRLLPTAAARLLGAILYRHWA
jgi:hypothetical protein